MATRTIDKNVLIRLLVDDHSEQVTIASRLAAQFRLVVLPTVLPETEWVLRSRFGLPRQSIVELFERIIDFDGFIVVEKERVGRAVHGFAGGMDFADGLHHSLMAEGDIFVTFDRQLVALAKRHIGFASVELAH